MSKVVVFNNYKKEIEDGLSKEEVLEEIANVDFDEISERIFDNFNFGFSRVEVQLDLLKGGVTVAWYMQGQSDIYEDYITLFTLHTINFEQGEVSLDQIRSHIYEYNWESIDSQLDRHYPTGIIYIAEIRPFEGYVEFFEGTYDELTKEFNIDQETYPTIEDIMMEGDLLGDIYQYRQVDKEEYDYIKRKREWH